MTEKKENPVTVKKVVKNYDKMLAAFGGMVAGKALSHFLDKAVTSQPVQGLVGVEMSENLSKFVKPIVITGVGMTAFAVSKNAHIRYAGVGFAGIGVSELANSVLGKDYLSGLGGGFGFGNQDFDVIDINTMMPVPPAAQLNLPALTGSSFGAENPSDNYRELYDENEITDYADVEELEAA